MWYFWDGGKKDRMVIGERQVHMQMRRRQSSTDQHSRYTNQSALWDWALSDEHTNIAKDLPRLIDIFSARIQADISIDVKDLIK
jgi:hypothetical protein